MQSAAACEMSSVCFVNSLNAGKLYLFSRLQNSNFKKKSRNIIRVTKSFKMMF